MPDAGRHRVGIGGLGTVGRVVARRIDEGLADLELAAVSARRPQRARELLDGLGSTARIVTLAELAEHCDVVVEAAPAAVFRELATPVLNRGKKLVVLSSGALLDAWDLVDLARERGAEILLPTGALLGLDAVLAAAEGEIHELGMITRKPVRSLQDAPFVQERGISLEGTQEPVQLFEGPVREAIRGFPANLNVAVALSLAGVGPDQTRLQVWAEPALERIVHHIHVRADSAVLDFTIENVPSAENPRTSRIVALSVVAALRKLVNPLKVGT